MQLRVVCDEGAASVKPLNESFICVCVTSPACPACHGHFILSFRMVQSRSRKLWSVR